MNQQTAACSPTLLTKLLHDYQPLSIYGHLFYSLPLDHHLHHDVIISQWFWFMLAAPHQWQLVGGICAFIGYQQEAVDQHDPPLCRHLEALKPQRREASFYLLCSKPGSHLEEASAVENMEQTTNQTCSRLRPAASSSAPSGCSSSLTSHWRI